MCKRAIKHTCQCTFAHEHMIMCNIDTHMSEHMLEHMLAKLNGCVTSMHVLV